MLQNPASYRADIDGLRAVSVFAVICFHINLVPGGFVGVDVFFVISGFLIGGIVFRELAAGKFSFTTFYLRRVRRILPALIVTLMLSCAVAPLAMAPSELRPFADSALAALASIGNVYFYLTRDYFAPIVTDVPLLHLWSLGVEEQFYLVFPLIALLLARRSIRMQWIVFLTLGTASLIACQVMLEWSPQAAFYLFQYRAFELAAGILLARKAAVPAAPAAPALAIAGSGLLATAVSLFTADTRFPGLPAMLPVTGAVLLIWVGGEVPLLRLILGSTPLAYLGRISYPIYLVHWPLIVFGKRVFPSASDATFGIGVLVLSVLLAIAIYHLVEQPVRRGSARRLAVCVGLGSFACVAGPGIILAHYGNVKVNVVKGAIDELYLRRQCFLDPDQGPEAFTGKCMPAQKPRVLLLGDSHAAHFYHGLYIELAARGYALGMLTAGACPPVMGYRVDGYPHCEAINRFTLSVVRKSRPQFVVLSAFWKPTNIAGLASTLKLLLGAPEVSIVVLGNTPVFAEGVPAYIDRKSSQPIRISDGSAADLALAKLLTDFDPRVRYVPIKPVACPAANCILHDENGANYYIDEGHLGAEGSRWLAAQIVPKILGP